MKRIPMLLLLIARYLFVGSCLVTKMRSVFSGFVLLLPVLLLNMGYAFFLPKFNCEGRQILFWNMLLKLWNIPIYLLIFFVVLLLPILILPMLPFLFLLDYLLLLSSSMYGISGILVCYKEKKFSRKEAVLNVLLQVLFCTDVLSAVYCYIRASRS